MDESCCQISATAFTQANLSGLYSAIFSKILWIFFHISILNTVCLKPLFAYASNSWVPLRKFAHFPHYLKVYSSAYLMYNTRLLKKLTQYWLWILFHSKQLLFHLLYIFFHLFLQNILTTYRIGSWNRTKTYPLECRQEWKPYAGVQPRISQVRRGFLE